MSSVKGSGTGQQLHLQQCTQSSHSQTFERCDIVHATTTPYTYGYAPHGPEKKLATPDASQPDYALPPAHAAGREDPALQVFPGYVYPAAAVSPNGQPAVVVIPGGVVYSQIGNKPCDCSAGWVLFGVGWIFPICWLVGVFLPCCSKNKNDRRAAIGSGVMLAVTVIIIILCIVLPLTIATSVAGSASHQTTQYTVRSHSW